MIDDTNAIANQTISWAAQLLVDQHGSDAPDLAARCARDMAAAGRLDLACAWEVVCQTASLMVAAAPPAAMVH